MPSSWTYCSDMKQEQSLHSVVKIATAYFCTLLYVNWTILFYSTLLGACVLSVYKCCWRPIVTHHQNVNCCIFFQLLPVSHYWCDTISCSIDQSKRRILAAVHRPIPPLVANSAYSVVFRIRTAPSSTPQFRGWGEECSKRPLRGTN